MKEVRGEVVDVLNSQPEVTKGDWSKDSTKLIIKNKQIEENLVFNTNVLSFQC
jgi:hypothetical protein